SPFINSDDKEPSFDGKVIIHSDKKGTKDDIKQVLVQVKGKLCDDLSQSEISYRAEIKDLKNYLYGGVIYFVAYITKDGLQDKVYYSALTPVKLKSYLKDIKQQKQKSIKLKEFPLDNDRKINIFLNFFNDSIKQISFVDQGFISLDTLD